VGRAHHPTDTKSVATQSAPRVALLASMARSPFECVVASCAHAPLRCGCGLALSSCRLTLGPSHGRLLEHLQSLSRAEGHQTHAADDVEDGRLDNNRNKSSGGVRTDGAERSGGHGERGRDEISDQARGEGSGGDDSADNQATRQRCQCVSCALTCLGTTAFYSHLKHPHRGHKHTEERRQRRAAR